MKSTAAIPRFPWLAASALTGALVVFLVGGCSNNEEPPLTPPAAEPPKPLESAAVQVLLADLASVYDAPDPLPAIVRFDHSVDSLAIADSDSLAIWVKSAAVRALAVQGRMERLDSLSRTLADTLDAVLEAAAPWAGKAEPDCLPPAVLYVNGINTTHDVYVASRKLLEVSLREAGIEWPVFGAYNVSAKDTERSVFGGVICPVFQYVPYAPAVNCGRAGFVIDFTEAGAQELQQWGLFDRFNNRDVSRVANAIMKRLAGRRGLVIVAHSQGNLMVNQAMELLYSDGRLNTDSKLRLVRLGSPIEDGPIGIRRRFDVCGDPISALANYGYWSCLERSPDCGWFSRFLACPHDFTTSYMHGANRAAIVEAVRELGEQLLEREVFTELATSFKVIGSDYWPLNRIGLSITGETSCLGGQRQVRAKIYRTNRGSADPEAYELGPVTVTPARRTFSFTSRAMQSCEGYSCAVEILRDGNATWGETRTVETGTSAIGTHHDYAYFRSGSATGDWYPNGTITNDRESGKASSGTNFYLVNRAMENTTELGVRRLWLYGGQVDEVQRWSADCAGDGVLMSLAGGGAQVVRLVNDAGNEQNVTFTGTVTMEVLDRRNDGSDVVHMYFAVNPDQRYGDRAAPGPFRAELSGDGIELILGLR